MYYTESRGKEKDIAENQTGFLYYYSHTYRYRNSVIYNHSCVWVLSMVIHLPYVISTMYVGIIVGSCTILGIKLCIF